MKKEMECMLFVFVLLAGTVGLAQTGAPQGAPPPQPLSVEKVAEGIYLVSGGAGANCGFVVGENEVVLIDAKMTEQSTRQMVEAVRKVSAKPIRLLLLTHSDGDHVNGIQGLPENVLVVSHQQTRVHMDKAFTDAALRKFLPAVTFAREASVYPGLKDVRLLYFGPAHTDGDTVIYIPESRVAFAGDLLFIGRDPLIHLKKEGSSAGLIQTWKELLNLDIETFVSGHAKPAGRNEAEEFVKGLEAKRDKIVSLVKAGKSLAEIKSALGEEVKPVPEGMRRWPSFVEIVYQELTAKK